MPDVSETVAADSAQEAAVTNSTSDTQISTRQVLMFHIVIVPFRQAPRVESFKTREEWQQRLITLAQIQTVPNPMRAYPFEGLYHEITIVPTRRVNVGGTSLEVNSPPVGGNWLVPPPAYD